MNRRDVVKQALVGATGVGLIGRAAASELADNVAALPLATDDRKSDLRAKDGTYLFHRDWGSGRPVVFLHGWGLNSSFWEYQMAFVADHGFRAVSFDRRSHGRSGDPGRGYDYDTLANDVAAIVDGLNLREITLVAHSLGGGEAVRYLTRHGIRRVTGLVLVGATLPYIVKAPDNPTGVDKRAFDGLREALGRNRAKWLSDNSPPFWMPDSSPELRDWGHIMPWQCSLRAMLELTHVMSETDFRAELRALPTRTLIVHGTADRSVPIQFARATAALIHDAQMREYDGAPHGLPLTHMERLNADLLEFMAH
jgi:non-heme chloroperoxidase